MTRTETALWSALYLAITVAACAYSGGWIV